MKHWHAVLISLGIASVAVVAFGRVPFLRKIATGA